MIGKTENVKKHKKVIDFFDIHVIPKSSRNLENKNNRSGATSHIKNR